jgi:hypothetical protein
MLTLKGQIINIFQQPKGEKDGKEYGGQDKIQILGDIPLQNGQTKRDIVTLTTHNLSEFRDFQDKEVSVPVGIIPSGKSLIYFIPKGSKPVAC